MNPKRKPSRWPYQLVTPHFEIKTNKRGIAWVVAWLGGAGTLAIIAKILMKWLTNP
jgi:hypothetical protein